MLNLRRAALLRIIVVVVIIFSGACAYCAEEAGKEGATGDSFFTEIGFIGGFGSGNLPEGTYQPILLIGHFGVDMRRYFQGLKDHRGTLSVFLEPQFDPVFRPQTDYEAGVGIGLQYQYPIDDKVSFYILGSTGPHYISVVTSQQAAGFVFADTLGGGFYYYLSKKSAINFGYRLRHLSNMNIQYPNLGINTNFGVLGYSVFF